ncbi:hypothetical protein BH23ACT6_BH23ACT6_11980 [soil metagenome]
MEGSTVPHNRRSEESSSTPPGAVPDRDMAWWSAEPGSRKKAEEEFRKLPEEMQGRLLKTVERYLLGTSRRGDVAKLDSNIFEWRARKGTNHFRVLFSVGGMCRWL